MSRITLDRRNLLIATFLIEGALIFVSLIWAKHRQLILFNRFDYVYIAYGVLLCFPLFLLNAIFFAKESSKWEAILKCQEFKDEIAKPLADKLDIGSAFIVSALAGFGEEMFCRGILQTEFGIVIASAAFAILHFGSAVKHYLFIAALYLLIGFYFGFIYLFSQSIWTPIIVHVVYDFVAILYLRYFYEKPSPNSNIR
ncbi:MAG: CPBP family intramembrane metalloprotease [Deltaproteobacteria bacterium]|nr:CPBP family intramembrane metalloprotease [Deltaproteobacteria bacterium]